MNIGIGKFLRNGLTLESIEQAFRRLAAAVSAGFLIEHKEDGTHSHVTADTVTFGSDPLDGSWEGNVGSSLVPMADGYDLGAVVTGQNGSDPLDHPWQDLRLSGTLYIGADWEATIIDGIPTIARTVNGLTVDIQGQSEFVVTGSTAGELQMTSGNLSYDGNIDAVGAVTAGNDGFFERGRSKALGEWTAVAHNAANFTASAGTWTVDSGDQLTYAYTLVGKTMTLMFYIQTTDVSNAASLRIAIPGGFTATKATRNLIQVLDAGNPLVGLAVVAASGTYVECFASVGAANFSVTAADDTYVIGQITFEVS